MKVEYLNPFVEGVDHVFQTMLKIKPERRGVKLSDPTKPNGERITALIGISGQVGGVVALRFPPATALALASRFLGMKAETVDDMVIDSVSELVNMVAGQAKARFEHDPPLRLGLPTVVQGADYRVSYPAKSVWLEVPYGSEAGEFTMEVTYSAN